MIDFQAEGSMRGDSAELSDLLGPAPRAVPAFISEHLKAFGV